MTHQLENHVQEILIGATFARWTDNARRAWAGNILRVVETDRLDMKQSIIEILTTIKKGDYPQ